MDRSVGEYCVDLVAASRSHRDVLVGASPRGSLALMLCARALAVISGRDFVLPEDVKAVAGSVLAHRITVKPELWMTEATGASIVEGLLATVPTPTAQEPGGRRARSRRGAPRQRGGPGRGTAPEGCLAADRSPGPVDRDGGGAGAGRPGAGERRPSCPGRSVRADGRPRARPRTARPADRPGPGGRPVAARGPEHAAARPRRGTTGCRAGDRDAGAPGVRRGAAAGRRALADPAPGGRLRRGRRRGRVRGEQPPLGCAPGRDRRGRGDHPLVRLPLGAAAPARRDPRDTARDPSLRLGREPAPRRPDRPEPVTPQRGRQRSSSGSGRSSPATGCAASTGGRRCAPARCTRSAPAPRRTAPS